MILFDVDIIEEKPQSLVLRVKGNKAISLFKNESGGHRWQRVPPTERKGRVHSSTVTVAIIKPGDHKEIELKESDIEWKFTCGSGPGGQKRNKTASCAIAKHIPTGETVRCEIYKSQHQNRAMALTLLSKRINEKAIFNHKSNVDQNRRDQVGSGERSDKIRTVQEQNGIVINHLTGKRLQLKQYEKGDLRGICE